MPYNAITYRFKVTNCDFERLQIEMFQKRRIFTTNQHEQQLKQMDNA